MAHQGPIWTVALDDPRAPPTEIWDALSDDERTRIVDSLPSSVPPEMVGGFPEGDLHADPCIQSQDTLRSHFDRSGRGAYVGSDLAVYYPDEHVFAPDVFVVLDVETHPREKWVVHTEGRGLDFVLEVLVRGSKKKDLETNVARYARLHIPEYFVYEPLRKRLRGFRLAPAAGAYERIVPQRGHFESAVLGVDLMVLGGRLRFVLGESPLPSTWDLNDTLNDLVDELGDRAEAEAQRAEAEAQRAEAEAQRADEAERRLAEALERLRQLEEREPPS